MSGETQESVDAFYWKNGPCCAGCDWWRHFNAVAGECTASAPVPSTQRGHILGGHNLSMEIGAGHVFTPREHLCGQFKDEYDWKSLNLVYRKRVGAPT